MCGDRTGSITGLTTRDYRTCLPNRVGVSYLMMQALPESPYNAYGVSREQKKHVLDQVADILIEISKHPLPLIESLTVKGGHDTDQFEVSAMASNRFVALHPYGPFKDSLEYLRSITESYLDLIADGQLHHTHPLKAFILYHFLNQNALTLLAPITHAAAQVQNQTHFFPKHVDDKDDHPLVDENYNVTGIIDWQFARVVPPAEAFGPSYSTADSDALYSSKTEVNEADRLLARALGEVRSFGGFITASRVG
ncbi:hypothetical protein BDW69DRAFT_155362 [Aspergillus filifer]